MLDNINRSLLKKFDQAGVTIVELLVVIGIASSLLLVFTTISVNLYGDTVRTTIYSQLANESQNILRSIVEELRQSSSIKVSNSNPDSDGSVGGWNTSDDSLILIISTPALDSDNNFIMDSAGTGYPYQNEIVYFASGGKLFKRYLANQNAPGNTRMTTCPLETASASCPSDIEISKNFTDMSFVFYDQNDQVTASIPNARSIHLFIQMERKTFGKTLQFDNNIRITIRNTAS